MRVFRADELRRFLAAVDANLTERVAMLILGGGALALYGVDAGTSDIDTWETDLSRLQEAMARARAQTGLNVPVSQAAVADTPYHCQDRLWRVFPEFQRLDVFTLEIHDLALSKAVRGYENDLAGIEALHRIHPLDLVTLVGRYVDEMGHVIGGRSRLDRNLLLMIERLFGEIEADRTREELRRRRRSPT